MYLKTASVRVFHGVCVWIDCFYLESPINLQSSITKGRASELDRAKAKPKKSTMTRVCQLCHCRESRLWYRWCLMWQKAMMTHGGGVKRIASGQEPTPCGTPQVSWLGWDWKSLQSVVCWERNWRALPATPKHGMVNAVKKQQTRSRVSRKPESADRSSFRV